ncbi:MAG: hypothetical protein FJ146_06235 [Deltaproteobacteria bacterium]|nr:hypothetical protein [Deltaproteobacteria bacterium]
MKKMISVSVVVMTVGYSTMASAAFVCGCWGNKRPTNNPSKNFCDYSQAASNNGWGWNAATQKPCPPQNGQGYCDYSHADSNDGWGWNPVTNTSCR